MSLACKSKIEILRDRAEMLRKSREFFHGKGVLEVDTPLLSALASVDEHIDLIPAHPTETTISYLVSSPEYAMKRLLAEGIGDCYQLSHVFRKGERGQRHLPEFTMTEWYRLGMSFEEMIRETIDYIQLFIGEQSVETLTYLEAFQKYLDIDLRSESYASLKKLANSPITESQDDCLNLLLAEHIEPHLGKDKLTILTHYPASQAALANTTTLDNYDVALRFEIYHQGLELCNGYDELTDAKEQKNRLNEANKKRLLRGKPPLPIDEEFLKALELGVPTCSGVAVGFDRLMMLRHGITTINEILPV